MGLVQAVASKPTDKSAPDTTIACDQAIFTSIRTPMGEGYRIVAASRGLQPAERQTITRCSPSHGGLCGETAASNDQPPLGEPMAAAFYPLPGGRLCVSLSCFAGAEHTGRGGQRVYTHCVALNEQVLERFGYNAFEIIRAMEAAGLANPVLKPPTVLPDLQLEIRSSSDAMRTLSMHPTLGSERRRYVLQQLFDEKGVIVDTDNGWLESTEALLLGLPGPMRAQVSFGAGLQFSMGRRLRLHLLHDETGQVRKRIAGQPIECVDAQTACEADTGTSDWNSFVERHWASGALATLARRTSRAFADVSPPGRQRIGQLYNQIDNMATTDTAELLALASEHLQQQTPCVEQEIAKELTGAAKTDLAQRFAGGTWADIKPHWSSLIGIWKRSNEGAAFAGTLVEQALQAAMRDDPVDAAATALTIARETHATGQEMTQTFTNVLTRLAEWLCLGMSFDRNHVRRLCELWRALRPNCPVVERISQGCAAPAANQAGT